MTELTFAFGQPLPDLGELDDAGFLRSIAWSKGADRKLRRAAADGDVHEFARLLRRQLREAARRGLPPGPRPAIGSAAVNQEANGQPRSARIGELREAIEALAGNARDCTRQELMAGWRSALVAAIELSLSNGWPPVVAAELTAASPDLPLLERHAGLPWLAALVFADVKGAKHLRKAAEQRLHAELLDRTDDEGVPQAATLHVLPEWFATLVRAADWGATFDRPLWNADATERFAQLTRIVTSLCDRQAIPATRPGNGEASGAASGRFPPLSRELPAAARLAGWKKRQPAARLACALANGAARRPPDTRSGHRPLRDGGHLPSTQSDASGLACLRTDWSIDADVLVVTHQSPIPELRLSLFGVPLICGPWEIDVHIDGQSLALGDEWHCVCWASDDDGDYLELQQRLADGVRIERQVLLTREDRLLVLADAISGAGEVPIEYVSRLALVDGATATPDRETREIRIARGKLAARAFPLALPDDRIRSTSGEFTTTGSTLELRQTARGGLYAPLVLDWHPRRRKGYADWRTLTVAEDGRRLTQAEAWGHRLRLADHQILIYRSLTETRPLRTILGHHMANETLIARFDSDGEVEPYVMVE